MQVNVALRAAIGPMLLAAVVAGSGLHAMGQEPALSGAVDAGGAVAWSAADPGGEVIGPSVVNEYLGPIPAPEDPYGAAVPGGDCNSCNGGGAGFARGFYNRCGCDTPLFPWFTGPGNCDNWCVGPHWNVELDGMFVHRENAGWSNLANFQDVVDEFDYGPGVRLFVTGYNYSNYGVQVGYEGVNDFHSTALVDGDELSYESTLNSLEVNLLRRRNVPLKLFAGGRYVEIDESLIDTGDDLGTQVENRLMGFQVGVQRDAWQLNKWVSIEPFGNIGAYFNDFKRENVDFIAGTTEKREFSEIAFLGEAGVTSVLRINACLALRGGYQIMAFHGVSNALDTSLAANNGFDPDQLIYHGARFGIEYQR